MKEIQPYQMQYGESYLVYTGHDWSPSGFDLANYERMGMDRGSLTSQSNGQDLLKSLRSIKIYQLPDYD